MTYDFTTDDVTDDAEVLEEDGGLFLSRRSRKLALLPCRDVFNMSSQLFLCTRSATLFTARDAAADTAAAAADDDDDDDGGRGGGGGDGLTSCCCLTGGVVLLWSPPAHGAVTSVLITLGRCSVLSWHDVDDVMTIVGTECDTISACCRCEPTVSLPPVAAVLPVVLVTVLVAVVVVDVAVVAGVVCSRPSTLRLAGGL